MARAGEAIFESTCMLYAYAQVTHGSKGLAAYYIEFKYTEYSLQFTVYGYLPPWSPHLDKQ